MLLAARLREAIGAPGMSVEQTIPFRDKGRMKEVLDAAGIRTPRSQRTTTAAGLPGGRRASGLPLDHQADLGRRIAGHVSHREPGRARGGHRPAGPHRRGQRRGVHRRRGVHLRDRVRGRHHRLLRHQPVPAAAAAAQADRVAQPAGDRLPRPGRPRAGRRPRPWARRCWRPWASPAGSPTWSGTGWPAARWCSARSVPGRRAPGSPTCTTSPATSTCSPAGPRPCVHGRFTQPVDRRWNAAMIIKRAEGQGRISRIDGLGHLMATLGEHVVNVDLLPLGAPSARLAGDGAVRRHRRRASSRPGDHVRARRPGGQRAAALRRVVQGHEGVPVSGLPLHAVRRR